MSRPERRCTPNEGWYERLYAAQNAPGSAPAIKPSRIPAARSSASPRPPQRPATEPWSLHGPTLWAKLHEWAKTADLADAAKWLDGFQTQIHNYSCQCRTHWLAMVQRTPPRTASHAALQRWTLDRHNEVNKRLGKPEMAYEEAAARWGWIDG
jgi:hypothetical protein